MASILMGTATSLLMLLMSAGCFVAGYKAGRIQTDVTQKAEPQPTEEQKRMAEGFTNLLNYANRHIAERR